MRTNLSSLQALPQFSVMETPKMGKWARLQFSSVRAAHDASREYARTSNERAWRTESDWIGLEDQELSDFDTSGIAAYPLKLVQAANAAMPKKHTRLAQPRAAITGGYWDTPSVLANLPLAARTRVRAKLPPRDVKIAFFLSAGIDARTMATITAKIARAIWDYTLAGGAVNLTVAYCGQCRGEYRGVSVETKVNCSDVAGLAMILSPAAFRAVTGPLITATSPDDRNSVPSPSACPIPGFIWAGGVMHDAIRAAEQAIKSLEIV